MSDPSAKPTVTQAKLAEYERYADAQKAVDTLSDEGFPVASVSIVEGNLVFLCACEFAYDDTR